MTAEVGTVARYQIKLPSGDSMIALVDDETGLLVIYEYDGCWGHRWNVGHLGGAAVPGGTSQSLTSFVLHASNDYLARKLVPSDKWQGLDETLTIKAHHEEAANLGLADNENLAYDIDTANWDDVEAGHETNPLADYTDDHSNLLVYTDTRWMKMVRDTCIPALKDALRRQAGG